MKRIALGLALLGGLGFALTNVSLGHGGTYRGPGDTVPPAGGGGAGGNGPGTGAGPATSPGPTGPDGPGSSTPGGRATTGRSGPRGPRSQSGGAGDDLTGWEFWWAFNKEPYLNLKSAVHAIGTVTNDDSFWLGHGQRTRAREGLRPSEKDVREKVVPALLDALASERDNDLVTGCLIALAKIGDPKDEGGGDAGGFAATIARSLVSSSQEIRETAALSLGILGNESAEGILTALARDDRKALVHLAPGSASVDDRTRTFATYALGLLGRRSSDPGQRVRVVQALVGVFDDDGRSAAKRDLPVAAILAVGLVPLEGHDGWAPPERGPFPVDCREAQVEWLLRCHDDGALPHLVRAHVPTALARILQPADPRSPFENAADRAARADKLRVASRLLQDLDEHARVEREVVQSSVLALGLLGDTDQDAIDVEIRAALVAVPERFADHQTRHYAMIATGLVGGRAGEGDGDPRAGLGTLRSALHRQVSKGKSQVPTWAALGLAVMERSLADDDVTPSGDSLRVLRESLDDARSPSEVGAFAIALGISEDPESRLLLEDKLERTSDRDARGYLVVALGLLGNRESIGPIQALVSSGRFDHELMRSVATGLGLLGDKTIVGTLSTMLSEAGALSSQASIARALGFIGDRDAIDPLVALLRDERQTGLARGFAAAALGIVADKEDLPWNARVSVHLNYRANTETLTDPAGSTGILDIL